MAMKILTALQTLGLDTTSTDADVKLAWRDLAKIWHPDRFQNDERLNSRTEEQLKLINEAKSVALDYWRIHGHFLKAGEERPKKSQRAQGPRGPEREWKRPPPREEPRAQQQKQRAEPKREKTRKKPEEPKIEPEIIEPPSFQFGQNALIVVFMLLLVVSFIILLLSSLGESPADKVKKFSNKAPAVSPLRRAMADKDAELGIIPFNEVEEEQEPEPPPESTLKDTFFTLGSDKEWVSKVQGPPLQIKGDIWRYGFSTIEFEYGLVIAWKSSELNPLNVGMILPPDRLYPERYFYLGSLKDEVIALQGAPSEISGGNWKYGEALVQFDADTVINWKNDANNRLQARDY